MANGMTELTEVRSIRAAGDSWDITESVGATALGVAASRAVEAVPSNEEMIRLGRPVPDDMAEMTFSSVLLRARLQGPN